MSVEIAIARNADDLEGLAEILREYLTWDIAQLCEISGVDLDVEDYAGKTFDEIGLYYAPQGRLLLTREAGRLVGIGFLKPIGNHTCEIKRMYVRPEQRGKGLGKALLTRLIDDAKQIGYTKILLDSALYMKRAHALYRSMGFTDVEYYSEGETDEALKDFLVYMELRI